MLELVFTVCSIVEGAKCHELPPVPLEEETMMVGGAVTLIGNLEAK
jgi:hypothetical protein